VLILQLGKEGTCFCAFFQLFQEKNSWKSCNEIMENGPPDANMPEVRTENRKFIWSGLIANVKS